MKSLMLFSICLLVFLSAKPSFACESMLSGDSSKHSIRDPGTATICSAVIPGLGQVYNRKYWKVPLIYGAGAAAFNSYRYYRTRYEKIMEYYNEKDAQPTYPFYGHTIDADRLPTYRDHYRKYSELSLFSLAAIYLLNIIDAMVDAEFSAFDVSDNLTFNIRPSLISNNNLMAAAGISLSVDF